MENQHISPQSIDPLLRLWQRRKWVAIGVFLLIFVPGMIFLWSLPQVYEATATMAVPGASATLRRDGVSAFTAPLAAVSERVLSRHNLSEIITDMNLFPDQRDDHSGASLAPAMRQKITIKAQRANGPGGRNHVYAFTITYRNWHPEVAAAVANRLAKSYQDMATGMQVQRASQTAEALAARIAKVGQKLDKQRARINNYRKKHLGGLPRQQHALLAKIGRLNAHLQTIERRELATIDRRSELLGQTAKFSTASLPQLRQRLQQLRTIYTDEYPEVKQLKQRIATMERHQRLQKTGVTAQPTSAKLSQIKTKLSNLRAEESETRKKLQRAQKKVNMLPITSQHLQALTRGYSSTSGVYSALLKRYEHARVTAVTMKSTHSPYRILEPATAMGGPVGPKRLRFAVALLILSIIIGVGAAYFEEKRDTTFHSLEELRGFTSVPVLTTVPFIRDGKWHPVQTARSKAPAVMLIAGVVALSALAYVVAYGGQALTLALTQNGG